MPDNGTVIWIIEDVNGEALGELIVAWSAEQQGNPWTRDLTAWRVTPFLPHDIKLTKQTITADEIIDGATAYERTAQAAEHWNDYLADHSIQPGTTAGEFRGSVKPIPNFQF